MDLTIVRPPCANPAPKGGGGGLLAGVGAKSPIKLIAGTRIYPLKIEKSIY
jgi:hypothetical protein